MLIPMPTTSKAALEAVPGGGVTMTPVDVGKHIYFSQWRSPRVMWMKQSVTVRRDGSTDTSTLELWGAY